MYRTKTHSRAPYVDERLEALARAYALGEVEKPPRRELRERRRGAPWLEEELELIAKWPKDRPFAELHRRILRPREEIAAKLLEMRGFVPPRAPFTLAEEEYVCRLVEEEGLSLEEALRRVGRSSLQGYLRRLRCRRRSSSRKAKKAAGAGQ